jgi:hypothetical protein
MKFRSAAPSRRRSPLVWDPRSPPRCRVAGRPFGNAGSGRQQDCRHAGPDGFTAYQWISTTLDLLRGDERKPGNNGDPHRFRDQRRLHAHADLWGRGRRAELLLQLHHLGWSGIHRVCVGWPVRQYGLFIQYLFTARTTPSGDTVPGFGLAWPRSRRDLTPDSTPIIPGGPLFSPLGATPEPAFDGTQGCGYTGWIEMDYCVHGRGQLLHRSSA